MRNINQRSMQKIRRMKENCSKEGFEFGMTYNHDLYAVFESAGHGLDCFGHTIDPHALPREIIHNFGGELLDSVECNDKIIVIFSLDNDKVCKY